MDKMAIGFSVNRIFMDLRFCKYLNECNINYVQTSMNNKMILNKKHIEIINDYYYKDFIFFNYDMIDST
jgi:hypothetical protein